MRFVSVIGHPLLMSWEYDARCLGSRMNSLKHFPYHPWDDCIFTYMKTIKINHENVGKYTISSHGSYGKPRCLETKKKSAKAGRGCGVATLGGCRSGGWCGFDDGCVETGGKAGEILEVPEFGGYNPWLESCKTGCSYPNLDVPGS